ncbi:hypothetical protein GGH95_006043 [Coemansia sp. RSA 1836]|nr:hypothetical protein GGH95_006043 [Coemansia sp. RSA 1836]
MRFSLTLAASACLLALSNAATIGLSGSVSRYYTTNDLYCHDIPTMEHPRLQSMLSGAPGLRVMFYSDSSCKNFVLGHSDTGGQWRFIPFTVSSYRLMAL